MKVSFEFHIRVKDSSDAMMNDTLISVGATLSMPAMPTKEDEFRFYSASATHLFIMGETLRVDRIVWKNQAVMLELRDEALTPVVILKEVVFDCSGSKYNPAEVVRHIKQFVEDNSQARARYKLLGQR